MEQEIHDNEEESLPILCANNCGFFGSSSTHNLCSKCYKEALLSKSKAPIEADAHTITGASESIRLCKKPGDDDERAMVDVSNAEGDLSSTSDLSKKPADRCSFCNKKVRLMGFKCRCGDVFCSLHRYSDKHDCTFDYKGAGQDAIANANPIMKPDKVDKI